MPPSALAGALAGFDLDQHVVEAILREALARALEAFEVVEGTSALLAEQLIVLSVSADPEPHEPVCGFDSDGTVVDPNPCRPKAPNPLETE